MKKPSEVINIIWHLDEDGNKISMPINNEPHTVINSKITLIEIPDEFYGVTIKDGEKILTEIESTNTEKQLDENEFRVHYGLGVIFLNTIKNDRELTINYYSRGLVMYPASRIFTDSNEADGTINNLQDVLSDVTDTLNDISHIEDIVEESQRLEEVLDNQNKAGISINGDLNNTINNANETITHLVEEVNLTEQKKQELEGYVIKLENENINPYTESKKVEINVFTESEKDEINKLVDDQKSQLDVHKENLQSDIDLFSDNKKKSLKDDLDTHTGSKKNQLDLHVQDKKQELDEYKDSKITDLSSYTTQKKEEINEFIGADHTPSEGTKKKDINDFVDVKKNELDNHTVQKKEDITSYTESKKNELDSYEVIKQNEITNYISTELNSHTNIKKEEITNHTKQKIDELNTVISNTNEVIKDGDRCKSELEESISTSTQKDNLLKATIIEAEENHTLLQNDVNVAESKIVEIDVLKDNISVYEDYKEEKTYYPMNKVIYNDDTYIVLKEIKGITPIDDGVNYKLIVISAHNDASRIKTDAIHRFVSDDEKHIWNDKYSKNEVDNKISQVVVNLDWKETVNTFNDLTSAYPNAVEGWTASVKDEDVIYRFDGTKWNQISGVQMPLATEDLDGKMSSSDKCKLDNIEDNANNYIHPATHSIEILTETPTKRIMTNYERNKLGTIEENANNYMHPIKHSVDMITDSETKVIMNKDERIKLLGVEENANNYIHPATHNHSEIITDEEHSFMNKSQKDKLSCFGNQPMKKVILYYGKPSSINDKNNIEDSAHIYSQYDIVIFGDGYQSTAHEEHNNTKNIISSIKNKNKRIEIFGYIAIGGTKGSNLDISTIKTKIDEWKAMDVTGMFIDEFGYDYKVTRNRQNEVVNYIHQKGMNVIANSSNIDYVFSKENIDIDSPDGFKGNPDLLECVLGVKDYISFSHLFWNIDNNSQKIGSDQWKIYESVKYHQDINQGGYSNGKTYKEIFRTKVMFLDMIDSDSEEADRLFTQSYIGALIVNADAYCASINEWGLNSTNYKHYIYDFSKLTSSEKHRVIMGNYNGEYKRFITYINSNELCLKWDRQKNTTLDIGESKVEINGKVRNHLFLQEEDIKRFIDSKGNKDGLAKLDRNGKVPVNQIPPLEYIPRSEALSLDYLKTSGGQVNGTVILGSNALLDKTAKDGNKYNIINDDAKVWRAVYNDLAELMLKGEEDLEPGDVLVATERGLVKTNEVGDKRVIGVYSDTFGFCLGGDVLSSIEDNNHMVPIGISGRVLVKVKGNINIGDVLITSDQKGYAQKADSTKSKTGTIFAKALENYKENTDNDKRIWALIMNA